jgi:molybdate transport system ATP-binding protein
MGKSTMLKLLAGILKPSSGKVVHPQAYKKIGYLDQIPEIPQYQSFWEKRLKRNDFWVDTLGVDVLVNKWKEFPDGKSFSIGQRQKLALALVLSSQSNLLLLDEPVSAIPQAERKPFLKNLSNWASANQVQLVVVSHDLAPNYQILRMEKEREPS